MRKLKKAAVRLCSFLLAVSLLLGSAVPVFAEGATLQDAQTTQNETLTTPESTTPDNSIPAVTEPSDSSSEAMQDSESVTSAPESTPTESGSTPSETDSAPPDSGIIPPEETNPDAEGVPSDSGSSLPEEPPFKALAIAAFTPQAELLEDGQAQLTVTLNREDVAVTYQWQVKKPAETPELLFDYANYSDTSYYFPYTDISEAELLAMNPDATWPGIEMYLAAVEAAGGNANAVQIENGAENTFLRQAESAENAVPQWQDIAGATESSYIFLVEEESAGAVYRCVITITDEGYLAQAAEQMRDVYGQKAEEAPEIGEAAESAPTEQAEPYTAGRRCPGVKIFIFSFRCFLRA